MSNTTRAIRPPANNELDQRCLIVVTVMKGLCTPFERSLRYFEMRFNSLLVIDGWVTNFICLILSD